VIKANCGAGYPQCTNHWKQNKLLGGGVLYDMGVYSIRARTAWNHGMEPIAIVSAKTSTAP